MPSVFVDGFLETESTEINEKFDQYRELGKQIMIAKEDMSAATRAIQILEKIKPCRRHIYLTQSLQKKVEVQYERIRSCCQVL